MKKFISPLCKTLVVCLLINIAISVSYAYEDKASLSFNSIPDVKVRLEGPMKQRVENNVVQWVLRAPKANPALLSVFQLRDREPKSSEYYVPWVGEFIGKFLTNSILSLRMSDNPELEKTVAILIEQLIKTQDEDGYLGPFPKDERLLVCWDLWGHYHAITALLMWHERTGDSNAFEAACRAGDFICDTFLETGKRMKDVGSHEMNLSIITSLCQLYRLTGKERYYAMTQEVLKDWEETGDYYRTGLAGMEYFRTPRPRWESIHCILGLTELYQITGDENYRKAFMSLWSSGRKLDMHNNGSFSTNEQTIGNPLSKGAIETCCTVAWMAMTVDALRLSGAIECADTLELSTFNAATSLQHPSGSWSTYHTPMNGRREASFHSIVFQSRPGQPELNCCSVNAPRCLGMISDWGVMKNCDQSGKENIVVNYYGPGATTFDMNGVSVVMTQKTQYPCDGQIAIEFSPERATEGTILFRIPAWADGAMLAEPDQDAKIVTAGQYYAITRNWQNGDVVRLYFPMTLRYETGDLDFADRISIYRGPLLLAYDQRYNDFDENDIPAILPEQLAKATVTIPERDEKAEYFGAYTPWIQVTIPLDEGKNLVLTDFATAGVLGSTYLSWIPAQNVVPPIPACDYPSEGSAIAPGAIRFSWRRMIHSSQYQYKIVVSDTKDFTHECLSLTTNEPRQLIATAEQTKALEPNKTYYWKLIAENQFGQTESMGPGRSFRLDPKLPPLDVKKFESAKGTGPNKLLLSDDLAGKAEPTCGQLQKIVGASSTEGIDGQPDGSVRFDGQSGMAVYDLEEFPNEFTVSLDFSMDRFVPNREYAEVICGWAMGGDDPLRVFVSSEGKLFGRVEGQRGGQTGGLQIEPGKWYQLVVIKESTQWTLFIDGQKLGTISVADEVVTRCTAIALGGNPLFQGNSENLPGRIANFRMYAKALSFEDLK